MKYLLITLPLVNLVLVYLLQNILEQNENMYTSIDEGVGY